MVAEVRAAALSVVVPMVAVPTAVEPMAAARRAVALRVVARRAVALRVVAGNHVQEKVAVRDVGRVTIAGRPTVARPAPVVEVPTPEVTVVIVATVVRRASSSAKSAHHRPKPNGVVLRCGHVAPAKSARASIRLPSNVSPNVGSMRDPSGMPQWRPPSAPSRRVRVVTRTCPSIPR